MIAGPLVSVVIPAYNAQATIDETLRSVRGQSHRNLEIIVVDDGSTDATAAMVEQHITQDSRITLHRTPNGGVARARNHGWRSASADLVAFIDADDLWAEHKLARQLQALESGGAEVGLVYSNYQVIDADSRVIDPRTRGVHEGRVLRELCHGNFVGNGSSALVRMSALIEVGGFDPSLRDNQLQGCEDILFYLRIAENYAYAGVESGDVGYRELPGNMSSDPLRMLRSWNMAAQIMGERRPELRRNLQTGLQMFGEYLLEANALGASRGSRTKLWLLLLRLQPRYVAIRFKRLTKEILTFGRRRSPREPLIVRTTPGERFTIGAVN